MNAAIEAKGAALRAAGEKPYVIPGGGSNRVGALGYVSCAQELMQQADEMGLTIDRMVTATGSAGTQAGLVVGMEGMNAGVPVLGIGVRRRRTRRRRMCTGWRKRPPTMSACAAGLRARRWWRTATTSARATASRRRA